MSSRSTLTKIDDYTTGTMPDAETTAFEKELVAEAATDESPDLAWLDRFAQISGWFASRGGFANGMTKELLDEIRSSKPHVHYFEVVPGSVTEIARWAPDTELIAYRIAVDLRGFDEVDIVVTRADGADLKTFRDVQWDPSDGAIYAVCDEPIARAAFLGTDFTARIEGKKGSRRETVAEVTVREGAVHG